MSSTFFHTPLPVLGSTFLESRVHLPNHGPPGRPCGVCSSAPGPRAVRLPAPGTGLLQDHRHPVSRTALDSRWEERRGCLLLPRPIPSLTTAELFLLRPRCSDPSAINSRTADWPALGPALLRTRLGSLCPSSSCCLGWIPRGPDGISCACGLLAKGWWVG